MGQQLNSLFQEISYTQLAMRSLRPEDFSTSELVLHTFGPTQTVAKCVPHRWSIQYLFVLRGANNVYIFYLWPYNYHFSFIIYTSFLVMGPWHNLPKSDLTDNSLGVVWPNVIQAQPRHNTKNLYLFI